MRLGNQIFASGKVQGGCREGTGGERSSLLGVLGLGTPKGTPERASTSPVCAHGCRELARAAVSSRVPSGAVPGSRRRSLCPPGFRVSPAVAKKQPRITQLPRAHKSQ